MYNYKDVQWHYVSVSVWVIHSMPVLPVLPECLSAQPRGEKNRMVLELTSRIDKSKMWKATGVIKKV